MALTRNQQLAVASWFMAHRTVRSGYDDLVNRLNRFPQGAPPGELLSAILEMLFSPREAELVALLPIRPFTVDTAARTWRMAPSKAEAVLDELARRAVILDNHALWRYRAMAAVLGTILNLPPVKRALASRQLGSRYLEGLIQRFG